VTTPAGEGPKTRQVRLSAKASEFLADRFDWMDVTYVPSARGRGGGFDVILRIDGIYASREDGEGMARWWAETLGIPYVDPRFVVRSDA
jgi:hypothetical protein